MTIKEAVERMKKAGESKTRLVPITGTNQVNIQVDMGQGWATIMKGVERPMAEDILRQAKDRVILG